MNRSLLILYTGIVLLLMSVVIVTVQQDANKKHEAYKTHVKNCLRYQRATIVECIEAFKGE